MYRISRATAVATLIALAFHAPVSTLAATGATLEGTVAIPCDPSRVSEVASVQIQAVSGGPATTAAVDPSTGAFRVPGLTEGEYEVNAIGSDGKPLSPEPKRLALVTGSNTVVLSLQPPGCGEPGSDPAASTKKKRGKKGGLEDWHLTLIYFGVIGAIILALEDDEDPASPSQP